MMLCFFFVVAWLFQNSSICLEVLHAGKSMCNLKREEKAWAQATLPRGVSGLGVSKLSGVAKSAFVSSSLVT